MGYNPENPGCSEVKCTGEKIFARKESADGRGRVAIQLISTGGVYGAERALLELAGYLREQGWDSRVVALEGRGAAELARLAEEQGVSADAFVKSGRLAFLPMLARLRKLLSGYSNAILHSHGYKPDILLRMLNIPRRLACVATCHNWISETTKLKLIEAVDKRALRGFDHVAAVSPQIRGELIDSGVPASKVTLVNNGISETAADPAARRQVRAEFNLPPDERLIVQIGRLSQSKRNDLLIAAMKRLRCPASVLFIGDGEMRESLGELARKDGIEHRIHFCGYRGDIPRLLAAADLMVLSSEKEGLPITILEAMAMRCPIVTTNVGAIPQALTDKEDAWLVSANDAVALNTAIDDALGNPALARARAERAYSRFKRDYSREAMGRRYREIYENVWTARGWR